MNCLSLVLGSDPQGNRQDPPGSPGSLSTHPIPEGRRGCLALEPGMRVAGSPAPSPESPRSRVPPRLGHRLGWREVVQTRTALPRI